MNNRMLKRCNKYSLKLLIAKDYICCKQHKSMIYYKSKKYNIIILVKRMDKKMDYYNNTNVSEPHKLLKKYFEMNVGRNKEAIDFGCGAGRDTAFLLNKRI